MFWNYARETLQNSLKAMPEKVKIEKTKTQSYAVIITAKQNHVHIGQL